MQKLIASLVVLGLVVNTLAQSLYVSGNFSQVKTNDGSTLNFANIANYNYASGAWGPIDGSPANPNNPDSYVYQAALYSACSYVAFVGNFTKIGSTATGPIAFKDTKAGTLKGIGSAFVDATVYTTHIYCSLLCDCDIFVGGSFSINTDGAALTNIARYNIKEGKWYSLAAGVSSTVKKLYSTKSYVYALSDGGLFRFDKDAKAYSSSIPSPVSGVSVDVAAYQYNILSANEIFVARSAGNLSGDKGRGVRVSDNSALTQTDIPIMKNIEENAPISTIYCDYNNIVWIAGTFTPTRGSNLISVADYGRASTVKEVTVSDAASNAYFKQPITALFVCDRFNLNCVSGDFAIAIAGNDTASPGPYYFDSKGNGALKPFGQGIVPQEGVKVFHIEGGSNASMITLSVAAVVSVLFLLF